MNSPALRKYVESQGIDLGRIPEDMIQEAHNANLDPVEHWIVLGLDALRRTEPPLITTADPLPGDDTLIRIDDVRLTEDGRAAIQAMHRGSAAPRPEVGFRLRSGE